MDADRLGFALDPDGRAPFPGKGFDPHRVSSVGDQNLPRLGGLHQPGGEVHSVAHDGVLLAHRRPDLAAVDKANVDPDADRGVGQSSEFQRTAQGALGVILVGDGGTKQHDVLAALVAHVYLVQIAVVTVYEADHLREVGLQS